MLHLMKLAVGATSLDDIVACQHQQKLSAPTTAEGAIPTPFITTRNFPRRHAELLDGGSLYWVVGGALRGRQGIEDITHYERDDGQKSVRMTLSPEIIPVLPHPIRPFQGWRYLEADHAPSDLQSPTAFHNKGLSTLPDHLITELQLLCLL
ncbi:DUF1489 family protein [Entomobacter blattae]|uniref:DUF1489 family protein n=1 Tax=Entomobacter blattae TaxID=2762277 RepID=A0A7H1NQQ2_9PROT|nr:DUF1489 domain-containing protein [Entomobacter blattae]QNT78112.1 hypothetical protein JGUZn3_08800 [Entomobacter blattae]